jgi:hypothetical protein
MAKDSRAGESLWKQWHGENYYSSTDSELVYFTEESVDLENEIVRRALASTLQRDGIADSLADGFKMVSDSTIEIGWAGIIEGENEYTVCSSRGETDYGDSVSEIMEITWVEF